jgi:Phage integrase family
VERLKGSLSVEQPVPGDESRAIKRYLAAREDNLPWLFLSEWQPQLTRQAVNYIARLAGEKAKLGRVWPHMLRHSCGYYLADKGTDFTNDAGLPWASRPQAHGPLHPRCRTSFRGALAIAQSSSIKSPVNFLMSPETVGLILRHTFAHTMLVPRDIRFSTDSLGGRHRRFTVGASCVYFWRSQH